MRLLHAAFGKLFVLPPPSQPVTKSLFLWIEKKPRLQAVLRVIRKPLTLTQIWQAARLHHPPLLKQDVHEVQKKLRRKGLVQLLTPGRRTDRIFFLTAQGCWMSERLFGTAVEPCPEGIDWNIYAEVLCRPNAVLVLSELSNARWTHQHATIANVHRRLKDDWKKWFSAIDRTMRELVHLGLLEKNGETKNGKHPIYTMTDHGRAVCAELARKVA